MGLDIKDRKAPLILIGVGLMLYIISGVVHGGASGAISFLIAAIIMGVIQTIALIVVALIAGAVLNIGFGDMPTAILKFAAICAVCGGVSVIMPMGWVMAFVVFMALTMWLFELEVPYAAGLAAVFTLANLGVAAVFVASQSTSLAR